MWESHTDFMDCQKDQPIPKRPLPVYMIDEVGTEDGHLCWLWMFWLPTPAMSPPRATPTPSEHDQLIRRLLGKDHPEQPLLLERSSFRDMEILLQSLLPVGSPAMEQPRPTVHHNRSTVVCFSCGESGHAASRCPTLGEVFPFLPAGWRADRAGDGFVLRSPRKVADRHQAGNVV